VSKYLRKLPRAPSRLHSSAGGTLKLEPRDNWIVLEESAEEYQGLDLAPGAGPREATGSKQEQDRARSQQHRKKVIITFSFPETSNVVPPGV